MLEEIYNMGGSIYKSGEEGGGGDFVNIGGYNYPFVKIGTQYWITENLKYRWDGLSSQIGTSQYDQTPWGVFYNFDSSKENFGLLYNGYALRYLNSHVLELLPEGWKIPSSSELNILLNYCGGAAIAGKKLKSVDYNGEDDYGYNIIMGGWCKGPQYSSKFEGLEINEEFWLRNQNGQYLQYAFSSRTNSDEINVYNGEGVYRGYHIRLIKDV